MITYSAQASAVTLDTTVATLIVAANKDRAHLEIRASGTDPVFVGGSGVDSGTGYPVKSGAGPLQLAGVSATAALYGVSPSGNGINVLEVSG